MQRTAPLFTIFMVSLEAQKCLIMMNPNLSFYFITSVFVFISEKSLPNSSPKIFILILTKGFPIGEMLTLRF